MCLLENVSHDRESLPAADAMDPFMEAHWEVLCNVLQRTQIYFYWGIMSRLNAESKHVLSISILVTLDFSLKQQPSAFVSLIVF